MSDLSIVLAEAWQGERRLWVDGVMVDVSLGRHEDQLTASAGWTDEKVLKRTEQVCEGFKAVNIWGKPSGAVHNAFNTSGEDGLKCLCDLTFLLGKTRE